MPDKKGEQGTTVTTIDKGSQGTVKISEAVVESITGMAAREVEGVQDLGKGGFGRGVAKAFGGDSPGRGVKVEVGTTEVAIDLNLIVLFGHSIQDVCGRVRTAVTQRVAQMTGLSVKELNINVVDIYFPDEEKPSNEPRVQ